jgi:hypothetical protein
MIVHTDAKEHIHREIEGDHVIQFIVYSGPVLLRSNWKDSKNEGREILGREILGREILEREREREIDTHTRMAKEGKREAFQMEAI